MTAYSNVPKDLNTGAITNRTEHEGLRNESNSPVFQDVSEVKRILYKVEFRGEVPTILLQELKKQSSLLQEKTHTFACLEMAQKKVKFDERIFTNICFKNGYFDVEINSDIIQTQQCFVIVFNIILGQRYVVSKTILKGDKNIDNKKSKWSILNNISKGEYIDFTKINVVKHKIKTILQNNGYYFAEVEDPCIDIDRESKTATVTYFYRGKKLVKISDIKIVGANDVPKSFILKRMYLKKGELLLLPLLKISQRDLLGSGLFSEVKIVGEIDQTRNAYDNYQEAILNVNVITAPPRAIGVGAYFSVTDGPIITAIWQNKNFLKKAHDVGTIIRGGTTGLTATAFYNIPFREHTDFHADIAMKHMNTIAYEGDKISSTVGFIKKIQHSKHNITLSFLPTIETGTLTRTYSLQQTLFGFAVNVKMDFSNNYIYPSSGIIMDFNCQPYFGKFRKIADQQFTESENVHAMAIFTGSMRTYFPLLTSSSTIAANSNVLASFVSLGYIAIKDLEYTPFDKRFYGGGRTSIRAYGYQLCGDLDQEDRPVGGTSLLEICVEPRIRISKDWGVVTFYEASRISSRTSTSNVRILSGIGFGIRYFTKFGPIRFDIGIPLDRRNSQKDTNKMVDKPFQFYISVGQSF
ncbi:MAG: BamA/TamA family outer membrane protein [Holosporales bacterium]|nr:BamA/TamA family outer membrane protein [Holosporales bacterium]